MSVAREASSKLMVAFMSYAHHDDRDGRLSKFRDRLVDELTSLTGVDVEIFMDDDSIKLGEQWKKRLEAGLATSTFLLPIITPSFLTSRYCREELETFRGHERAHGRDDLILPVYYIACERFLSESNDAAETLRVVLERQYFDWRELRSLTPSNQRVGRARTRLAEQIQLAMDRTASEPDVPSTSGTPPVELPVSRRASRTLEDALRACCVRIDVGGRHAGSGFFAAPGVVVTCRHVLRLGDLSSDEAGARVAVISPEGGEYRVLDTREHSVEDDLAIMRVEPAHTHAFVLLDSGFRARDPYRAYGFSEEHPDGALSTLVVAGWLEADRILEVDPAGVRRGMSGSPVLNVRTGAVCGVLTRGDVHLRARAPVSGGRVISLRRLFALSPTLSSANSRHHTTHRGDWFDLLPADQKRLIVAQHPSDPAAPPDQLLVISVDQTDDEWEVSATLHRNDEDDGGWGTEASFAPIKVDLNSVRALVARVFRDWASRDAAEQGRVGPGEQIRLLGRILSGALLTGEIGRTFDELIAHQELGWLEVALHFSEDVADPDFREFEQLPWEHLYVPQRGTRGDVYFAREQRLAFVRTLRREPSTPDPPDGTTSLLVVAVRPPADVEVDDIASRDVAEITAALKKLGSSLSGSLDVTIVESPGLHGLTEAVKSCKYDAVHYVGVGRFDTGTDDRVALAIDPTGRSGYHNASDFGACLDEGMPRLVVLQVPRGPETVPPDLAAFGHALLRKGCLAVVAHQYPVSSGLTQKFNTALYTALAEGTPLEMAAQMARKKVWSSDSEGRAFLSPAVFVRNPGGLRLTARGREASRSRVGALSGHG